MSKTTGIFIPLSVIILTLISYNQGLKLDHVSLKVISNNPQFITNLITKNGTTKTGGRAFTVTFTAKSDLAPKNLVLAIRAYIDRGTRLIPAPIKITANVCDAMVKNVFGLRSIFKASNLTECPIKAGTYLVENWKPDDAMLPVLPLGRYQADMAFVGGGNDLAMLRWAGGVLKG